MIPFGLLLAQQFVTPSPIVVSTPAPISERVRIDDELQRARARARAFGIRLGAEVEDLTTGAVTGVDAATAFPLGRLQRVPIALLAYRAADAGAMPRDEAASVLTGDEGAEARVVAELRGADAIDTSLDALGLGGIFVENDGAGHATPAALRALIDGVESHALLSPESARAFLALLANAPATSDGEIHIAHLPGREILIVALLAGGTATPAQRAAIFARVDGAAAAP